MAIRKQIEDLILSQNVASAASVFCVVTSTICSWEICSGIGVTPLASISVGPSTELGLTHLYDCIFHLCSGVVLGKIFADAFHGDLQPFLLVSLLLAHKTGNKSFGQSSCYAVFLEMVSLSNGRGAIIAFHFIQYPPLLSRGKVG